MTAFCDLRRDATRGRRPGPGFYGYDIHVLREPVGVVAAVVPWNMPQFLIVTKLVPALLAGCTVDRQARARDAARRTAARRDRRARRACRPAWSACCPATATSASTWSATPAWTRCRSPGRRPRARRSPRRAPPTYAASASNSAASPRRSCSTTPTPPPSRPAIRSASLSNSGQICNALTRILVPASAAATSSSTRSPRRWRPRRRRPVRRGDPGRSAGGAAPAGTGARLHRRSAGARAPGWWSAAPSMPDGVDRGWYVRPTLFADADNSMRIAREEIFGPVLTVIPYARRGRRRRASPTTPTTAWRVRCSPPTPTADSAVADAIRTGTFGVNQGYTMDPVRTVRRREGQRLRPRTRPRGHRRVHRHQIDRGGAPLTPGRRRSASQSGSVIADTYISTIGLYRSTSSS